MKKLFLTLLLLVGFAMFNPANATEVSEFNAPIENVIPAQEETDVIIIYEVLIIDYYDEDGNYLGSDIYESITIIIIE
jgi:hypothetical protein